MVGTRSAVFAPLERVGLIVVDEEHDGSFKQGESPRYHARDVALQRATMESVPLVLGSATPSLESWHKATLTRRASEGVEGAEVRGQRSGEEVQSPKSNVQSSDAAIQNPKSKIQNLKS